MKPQPQERSKHADRTKNGRRGPFGLAMVTQNLQSWTADLKASVDKHRLAFEFPSRFVPEHELLSRKIYWQLPAKLQTVIYGSLDNYPD